MNLTKTKRMKLFSLFKKETWTIESPQSKKEVTGVRKAKRTATKICRQEREIVLRTKKIADK